MKNPVVHGALAAAEQREEDAAEARRAHLRAQYAPFAPPDETPVTLHCAVEENGDPPAEGHIETFAGVGHHATYEAAEAAGWKKGVGWVCPACASDPTPLPVVKVQLEGFSGPIIFRTVDAALEEVKNLLEDGADEGDVITVARATMTRGEVNALREFDGY